MKKFYRALALIAVAVLSVSFAAACSTTKSTDEKYFSFELDEETNAYYVSASSEIMPKTIIVPETYNGLPVAGVKAHGYDWENCYAITDLVFKGENVQIGDNAFKGLKNLRSVEFKKAVNINFGKFAFSGTTGLTAVEVDIANANVTIGTFAFGGSGIGTVYLNCENAVIDPYAFSECTSLKSIKIVNLGMASAESFNGCTSLKEIVAEGNGMTTVSGNLYSADGSTLIKYAPAKAEEDYTVVCESIGEKAFAGAVNLKKVILGDTVISVGDYAFEGSSVETVEVAAGNAIDFAENWLVGSKAQCVIK